MYPNNISDIKNLSELQSNGSDIVYKSTKINLENNSYESSIHKLSKNNDIQNLSNIDGIGETQIKSIRTFFSNKINIKVLEELKKIMKIFDAMSSKKDGNLKNKTFMFTGKLKEISRAEAKSLVEQNGGKILSSISKKLDYLVVGDKPTNKKIDQAKKNNIKVISQKDFETMLNRTQQP